MISLDFETRSEADLKKVGTYEYAKHPSTEPVCLGYHFTGERKVQLWHPYFEDLSPLQKTKKKDKVRRDLPATPDPEDLWTEIALGALVEAHHSFFERCIWHFVMVRKYGWPEIPIDQWRCSSAKCASFSLRSRLEHAAIDLGLPQRKDTAGHRTMLKLCQPRKPTKGDPDSKWHQCRDDLITVFKYNIVDVRTEVAVSAQLRPLSRHELQVWQMDQAINWRGFHADRKMVDGALQIEAEARLKACDELSDITYGAVKKYTLRVAFIEWLLSEGVKVPKKLNKKEKMVYTTDKNAIAEMMEGTLDGPYPEHIIRALEVWKSANKASKYQAFSDRMSADDDRIREVFIFAKAGPGRWASSNPQIQNMKRDVPKDHDDQCIDISTGNFELMQLLYDGDNILTQTSRCIRGAITAAPGTDLIDSDFSAVEPRGAFWAVGDPGGLDMFEKVDSGELEDAYCVMADDIYGNPRGTIKKSEGDLRQKGKVGLIGCGYQMGPGKLVSYAEGMHITITPEDAEKIVAGYRNTYWRVKKFWYAMNDAAMSAVWYPGRVFDIGPFAWRVTGRFLHMRLPSGRLISYLDPEIQNLEKPWGWQDTLTFMGTDTYTRQFKRCETYGGKEFENAIQGLCRDLLACAMLRLEAHNYPVVLHAHDEAAAEIIEGRGSLDEYNELMCVLPDWAAGFPLVAEGWRGKRYRK